MSSQETPRRSTRAAARQSSITMSSPLRYSSEADVMHVDENRTPSASRTRNFTSEMSSPLHYPTSSPAGTIKTPSKKRTGPSSVISSDILRNSAIASGRRSMTPAPHNRRGDLAIGNNQLERALQSDGSIPALPPHELSQSSDPATVVRLIWGTTINIQECMHSFKDFIMNFRVEFRKRSEGELVLNADRDPLYPKLLSQVKETEIYNMNLDCRNLLAYKASVKLYHQLVKYPQEIIPLMDHVLTEIFLDMFEDVDLNCQIKVRPFNLRRSVSMRELNPEDIDQLICVKGLVTRASPIIPDMKQAFFRCHTCNHTQTVGIDRGRIAEPTICPNVNCGSSNSMVIIHNRSEFANKQVCRLQETPDAVPDGQTPQTISLCLYDDLVDVPKAGDRLEITGIYRAVPVRVNPRQRIIKSLYRTYVDVVHIKRTDRKRIAIDSSLVESNEAIVTYDESDDIHVATIDEEEEMIQLSKDPNLYELLASSLAPSIFELEDVKKGILLQLFGGTNKTFEKAGSPRYRGDINIILVGDPGTSKSQMLQYVHKIAPRGIYTSGKGSSAVGLTAYITRDPDSRQLVLESGALVLSDGGVCCIDEFDKMSDETRAVLHEAMEQQTVSVAKAGIIATLNARTSICACANPIDSRWNQNLSIPKNLDLPPTLLSRFDLVFLILDKINAVQDRQLAHHLVSLYLEDVPLTANFNVLPVEKLTKYISYARNKIHPVLSEEAARQLIDSYVDLRKVGEDRNAAEQRVAATTRQLESMIRMSEAHAKMRLSKTVDIEDVAEAARLIREAIKFSATDPYTGKIDMDLITTGTGVRERGMKAGLLKEVRKFIADSSLKQISWTSVFKELSGRNNLSVVDFDKVLVELEQEGFIDLIGDGKHRLIRRILDKGNTEDSME